MWRSRPAVGFRVATALAATAVALTTLACDDSGGPAACVIDEASAQTPQPPGPSILDPVSGRLDIDPESVSFEATPPPAEVTHVETEAEIWRVAGTTLALRVWTASLAPDTVTGEIAPRFSLADGELEPFSEATGLEDWTDYAAVVRHRIVSDGDDCSRFTAWSEPRVFRIDDGSTYLFDESQILDIALTISPESMAAIDAEARPPGCVPHSREYYPADAIVDGTPYPRVGLRAKGGCGSARGLDQKTAFKIDLSWDDPAVPGCPETRRAHGLKRLTLNNMVQDPSFMHERLGYHFYKRMGVPTPRAANVRLTVNDEPWGLYVHVETIDRRMLSRWFESNGGMLYEGTYFCDLIPGNVPASEVDDSLCITRKFKDDACDGSPDPGDDPQNYAPIREFVAAVEAIPGGEFFATAGNLIEMDTFLSQWAADSIMGHWDAYEFSIINNYRVYHHPVTGKWTIIPTGIDQTFDLDQDPFDVSGILAQRCLAEPACEQAFVDRLREGIAIFESAGLVDMVTAIDAQIAADVAADPRKPGSDSGYNNARDATVNFVGRRADEIRARISARGF